MRIVITDTGCANIASVRYAVERLGYQPLVTADPDLIRQADKVFLPGVGTAGAAMENLTARGLVSTIRSLTQPVLGICLGMQLLGATSEEGNIGLLGLIDTPVQKMTPDGLPVPHMGWNTVEFTADLPLFRDIAPQSYFYFVHSYACPVSDATAATTTYGEAFSSVLCRDNFYGVQFHPERSGKTGITLIKNFLEMKAS
ncbi:imidazole glycerol phosphate synthase subunit HisH [Morganella morganii]|uniref:imidazole glycerol phosphate synthase subunit HisH n=1 Tax=Morganella morganii TaxID=582 RepID=UPI0011653FA3|nr:imidazole glycerol phosphate synthase subunit HisH [Morganella morganii]QQO73637.1 imidazole glycerol phosphate synthase subunit HisH [Morganella morganii]